MAKTEHIKRRRTYVTPQVEEINLSALYNVCVTYPEKPYISPFLTISPGGDIIDSRR